MNQLQEDTKAEIKKYQAILRGLRKNLKESITSVTDMEDCALRQKDYKETGLFMYLGNNYTSYTIKREKIFINVLSNRILDLELRVAQLKKFI